LIKSSQKTSRVSSEQKLCVSETSLSIIRGIKPLIMGSETLGFCQELIWLIARGDFIKFSSSESFKSQDFI
jgi:hypothetical protein